MKRSLPPFTLGFLSLALQVVLLREFFVHFQGNEMTYGLLLAAWLLWSGMGSLLSHRLKITGESLPNLLCLVLVISPVCLAGLRLSRLILGILPAEMTGPATMSAFALALSLLLSFPLGLAFVAAVRAGGGDAAFVYSLESLGAAAGGLTVYFLLSPHLSNWQAAGAVGLAVWTAVFFFPPGKTHAFLRVGAALASVLFFLGDAPTQKLYWSPMELVASRDTPYAKLQSVRSGGEVTLYVNGVPAFSSGDASSAEEAVHFALLQRSGGGRALLLGGGAGGGLEEALKHPGLSLDYVELDPEIIRLADRTLPRERTAVFRDARVRIRYRDGRAYLSDNDRPYDALLLNLPEPSTAQLNRYYTREFFELAARNLSPEGVLSIRVSSAENYLSPARARHLASLRWTLGEVFPEVAVVPGPASIFLASRSPLTLEAEILSREADRRGLEVTYVRREMLGDRLNPTRTELLRQTLAAEPRRINSDRVPLGYHDIHALWTSHFRGFDSRMLEILSRMPRWWLTGFPLILGLLIFLLIRLRATKRSALLAPLTLLGFSGIAAEVLVILRFQTLYGAVYGSFALLLACFMAGLWLGSLLGRRRSRMSGKDLPRSQAGIALVFMLILASLLAAVPKLLFFLMLLMFGLLAGSLFVQANALYIKNVKDQGTGYGLDLIGSFLGAAAVSTLLLPLSGQVPTAFFLLGLNVIALVFLLSLFSSGARPDAPSGGKKP